MKNKIKIAMAIVFFLMMVNLSQAQIAFDDDIDDATPAAPIDSFIVIALILGIILGIYYIGNKRIT